MGATKRKVISSLFWKLMERGGTQGVQFIVQIVLARLLLPEEYGIIALTTIFITVANVFIQQGFGVALIQKKKIEEEDLSSVFFLNLTVAFLLYIIIFFASPMIAQFYNQPILKNVLRVLSITLFMGAINSVQNAIVSRRMEFKRYFYSSISGIVLSGIVGIILAYIGAGVWALVINQIVNTLTITIVLWFTVKWRPKWIFSIKRLKELFSFGWKVLCSSLLDTIYNEMYGLVIGKVYTSELLGYYNRGQQFPKVIATNIDGSVSSVMLPTLSSEQDNKIRLKSIMRRAIMTSSFLLFPTMFGLAAIAEPMVKLVLTDKWLPCVIFIQMLCVSYAFLPIHTANLQAINAIGRSDIFLKLEIIKKFIAFTALFVSVQYSVFMIALSELIAGIIGSVINAYPNRYLLRYTYIEQMKDIIPSFLLSLIMAIIVLFIGEAEINNLYKLFLQIIVGVIVYIGGSLFFKLDSYTYIINSIKNMR